MGWHKEGTAQVPGQLISLFINKNHRSDNTYSQKTFLHLFLQIDGCCLVWSSLALSGSVLLGSGLLICWPTLPRLVDWFWPALFCVYLSLTWLKKPWMYCCCCPILIFYSKLGLKIKQNANLIINITQIVYWTAQKKKYTRIPCKNVCCFNTKVFTILHLKIPSVSRTVTLLQSHILEFTILLQTIWESDFAFNLWNNRKKRNIIKRCRCIVATQISTNSKELINIGL